MRRSQRVKEIEQLKINITDLVKTNNQLKIDNADKHKIIEQLKIDNQFNLYLKQKKLYP